MQLPFIDIVVMGIPELSIPVPKVGVCGEQEFMDAIVAQGFIEYVGVIGDIAFDELAILVASLYSFCDNMLHFHCTQFIRKIISQTIHIDVLKEKKRYRTGTAPPRRYTLLFKLIKIVQIVMILTRLYGFCIIVYITTGSTNKLTL